jgi:hypothetical protein
MSSPFPTSVSRCLHHALGYIQLNLALVKCEVARCIPKIIRGSFQKFGTLYVFSLKMNLFYKIHLQAFNVISIVFHHSGPTFGKVLYSCLDAFVVDASDYSGHLIRQLLNDSGAFPTEWFLRNKSKSGGLSPPDFDLLPVNVFCKINSFLNRKRTVCRTSEMTHVHDKEMKHHETLLETKNFMLALYHESASELKNSRQHIQS